MSELPEKETLAVSVDEENSRIKGHLFFQALFLEDLMKKRSKIFSIANQKGGVCKTTAAITLAQYFAAVERKKVLILDLDAQGNASHGLGIQKPTDAVYSILVKGTDIPAVLLSARENLDIVTSGPKRTANSLAISLMTEYQQNAKFALSLAFNNFIEENGYDYVFIDTPPAAACCR